MSGPTATQVGEAQNALMVAASKLAERPELQAKLISFINYWGLDSYQPDEETIAAVTNIVHGMVASANALSES